MRTKMTFGHQDAHHQVTVGCLSQIWRHSWDITFTGMGHLYVYYQLGGFIWLRWQGFLKTTIKTNHHSAKCDASILRKWRLSCPFHHVCIPGVSSVVKHNLAEAFSLLQLLVTPRSVINISIPAHWWPIVLNCWANCSISWLQIEFAHDSVW